MLPGMSMMSLYVGQICFGATPAPGGLCPLDLQHSNPSLGVPELQ